MTEIVELKLHPSNKIAAKCKDIKFYAANEVMEINQRTSAHYGLDRTLKMLMEYGQFLKFGRIRETKDSRRIICQGYMNTKTTILERMVFDRGKYPFSILMRKMRTVMSSARIVQEE